MSSVNNLQVDDDNSIVPPHNRMHLEVSGQARMERLGRVSTRLAEPTCTKARRSHQVVNGGPARPADCPPQGATHDTLLLVDLLMHWTVYKALPGDGSSGAWWICGYIDNR